MERYTEGFCQASDGTSIYYTIAGPDRPTAPDLVLCDGIGCDGFVWKYVVPAFADRHRVIRWHYRGHGRSATPRDLDRMAIEDLVGDLGAVLDAAGSERAILAGHSVGVQVVLEAHRRMPGRVAALVLVCGSYGRPLDTFHGTAALKEGLPYINRILEGFPGAVVGLWRALLPSRMAWLLAFLAGEVNRSLIRWEDMQPYFDHLGKMDPEVFVRLLSHAAAHSTRDHLGHVDVPTLVVGAELDTFTPMWLSEEMADLIPDAELLVIPKGSHAAPIEQPELLNLRLEKFFRDRLGCYAEGSSSEASSPGASA